MQKYAYITGADRGLGFELVKQFLAGSFTVFAGRYMAEWPWLDDLKQMHGDKLQPVSLDISDDSSVGAAAAFIRYRTDSLQQHLHTPVLPGACKQDKGAYLGRRAQADRSEDRRGNPRIPAQGGRVGVRDPDNAGVL